MFRVNTTIILTVLVIRSGGGFGRLRVKVIIWSQVIGVSATLHSISELSSK